MADTVAKTKLQLRTGPSFNGDKTPSPATKLLLNHGKPNFTIQRSPKVQQNGAGNPLSLQPLSPQTNNYSSSSNNNNKDNSVSNNNNDDSFKNANGSGEIVVQSTKFNGVIKPANIAFAPRQPHQTAAENEAAKVVLRRTRVKEPPLKEDEDDSVPEFIRRQRRIQERLAKDNLDFESRRSGYFTHVLISPSSTNRQSFAETMSSPAIVPSLEIPPPQSPPAASKRAATDSIAEESTEPSHSDVVSSRAQLAAEEEDEVAKAIEEVNKAVAGEDDDKEAVETLVLAQPAQVQEEIAAAAEQNVEAVVAAAVTHLQQIAEPTTTPEKDAFEATVAVATPEAVEDVPSVQTGHAAVELDVEVKSNGHVAKEEVEENGHAAAEHKETGHGDVEEAAAPKENGHSADITISHTNGQDGPSIPSPDPSGALGVNFEPKTVVSFSKDLGEPNKYPDTVKVTREDGTIVESNGGNGDLQELTKLKFDIKGDAEDVHVTPVLRSD